MKTKPKCKKPAPAKAPVRITTVTALLNASRKRKAVVCPGGYFLPGPRPAAFVINMSGSVIQRTLAAGLFLYRPTKGK